MALSVTMRGRLKPRFFKCEPTNLREPTPKWMGVGKENFSMLISMSSLICRVQLNDFKIAFEFPVGYAI